MGRQGDVLEIYEDKLEVAQIQKLILDSLQHRLGALAIEPVSSEAGVAESKLLQDAIMKLNSQLFNITDVRQTTNLMSYSLVMFDIINNVLYSFD